MSASSIILIETDNSNNLKGKKRTGSGLHILTMYVKLRLNGYIGRFCVTDRHTSITILIDIRKSIKMLLISL